VLPRSRDTSTRTPADGAGCRSSRLTNSSHCCSFAVQFNAGSPVVESTPQPSASACARESPAVEPTSTGESLRLKQSAQVNKIIDTARVMIRNHPAFAAYLPTVTSVTLNNCLESYVARLVYAKAFQPSNEIDAVMERDARLYDKIARFRFVTLQHLEISERLVSLPRNQPTLEQAQEWLLRLTRLKTPLEKMQAILQCCYMIYSVLQSNMATTRSPSRAKQPSAQQPGGECGADCFVPVLVYVILKANPPCLFSNIEYLSMYRHRSLLTGESAYYFVTFAGAVAFIENLDHTSLKLTSSEYLEHFGSAVNHGELLQAIRAVPQESSNKPADSQQPPQEPQPQQQQQQQQLIFDPLPPLDQPQPPAIEEEPAAPTPTPDQVAVAPEQEASSTESSKPESPEIEWVRSGDEADSSASLTHSIVCRRHQRAPTASSPPSRSTSCRAKSSSNCSPSTSAWLKWNGRSSKKP